MPFQKQSEITLSAKIQNALIILTNMFVSVLFLTLALAFAQKDEKKSISSSSSVCGESRDKGNSECGERGGRRFFFDTVTKRCQPFVYEGCAGTGNRFTSLTECKNKCAGFVPEAKPDEGGHGLVLPVPKCEGGVRAALDSEARVLVCPGDSCPDGYTCANSNCCPTKKELVCDIEYDTGKYATQGSHTPRFFYKKEVDNCLLFTYYGALGNANNFETYNECINYCKKA